MSTIKKKQKKNESLNLQHKFRTFTFFGTFNLSKQEFFGTYSKMEGFVPDFFSFSSIIEIVRNLFISFSKLSAAARLEVIVLLELSLLLPALFKKLLLLLTRSVILPCVGQLFVSLGASSGWIVCCLLNGEISCLFVSTLRSVSCSSKAICLSSASYCTLFRRLQYFYFGVISSSSS